MTSLPFTLYLFDLSSTGQMSYTLLIILFAMVWGITLPLSPTVMSFALSLIFPLRKASNIFSSSIALCSCSLQARSFSSTITFVSSFGSLSGFFSASSISLKSSSSLSVSLILRTSSLISASSCASASVSSLFSAFAVERTFSALVIKSFFFSSKLHIICAV